MRQHGRPLARARTHNDSRNSRHARPAAGNNAHVLVSVLAGTALAILVVVEVLPLYQRPVRPVRPSSRDLRALALTATAWRSSLTPTVGAYSCTKSPYLVKSSTVGRGGSPGRAFTWNRQQQPSFATTHLWRTLAEVGPLLVLVREAVRNRTGVSNGRLGQLPVSAVDDAWGCQ